MILKLKVLIFVLFICSGQGTAQVFHPQFKYFHAAHQIKNSPLIIRLNMKNRTINAYKKRLSHKNLGENEKFRTQVTLTALQDNRDRYKTVVLKSFHENFNFTKVLFIENQNFSDFTKGKPGLLFNKDKEVVSEYPDNYYVLIQGDNDLAWKIVDKNLKDLGSSVFAAELGFKRVVNWAVGDEDANINDMLKVSKKLNDRLIDFYDSRKTIELLPRYLPVPYHL